MTDSSISQLVGTTVAGYRLEQLVETHVWGPIFLANGPQSRQYTLRFIGEPSRNEAVGPARAERLVFLGRFQQEANRISTLRYPAILPLLDYGTFRGTPYLIYPTFSLPSLRALLARPGEGQQRTSLQMVGRSLEQIAAALSYAHGQAVLHHNLSTQCIYIQANRQLIIGEFGILRIIELSRPDLQTHLGSSESSAPEQLLGKSIDTFTDIYAMGAVLYRLLTGHPPFEGRTRAEIVRQHLYAAVPPVSTWRNDLSAEMDEVLIKALAKDPGQRYTSPEALVQAYYRALGPGDAGDRYLRMSSASVPSRSTSGMLPALRAVSLSGKNAPPVVTAAVPRVEKAPVRSRRYFIAGLAGAGGLAALAGVLLATHTIAVPGLTPANMQTMTTRPVNGKQGTKTTQNTGSTQIALAKDVPLNSAKTFTIANQKNPGLLIHLIDQRFVAFDSTCTHQGCAVKYNPLTQHLECPCHGAVFDPAQDASVVSGPAPSPLAPITIAVNPDGTIIAKNTNNA